MVKAMTDQQYDEFIEKVDKVHIRDQTIMLYMLHCGMRNGEVRNLNWQDVSIGEEIFHTISVQNGHSKSKEHRYLTITPLLKEKLHKYREWYLGSISMIAPPAPLFVTFKRRMRISERDIQRLTKSFTTKYMSAIFHPHALRHTFATRLMRCTNVRVVQQLLGHSCLQSTQVYTHPSAEDRKNAVDSAFK